MGEGQSRKKKVTLPDPWIIWEVQMEWLREFEEGIASSTDFRHGHIRAEDGHLRIEDIYTPPRMVIYELRADIYAALKTEINQPLRTDLYEPKTGSNESPLGIVCRPWISGRREGGKSGEGGAKQGKGGAERRG